MKSWVKFGLLWGIFMFLVLNIAFPMWDNKPMDYNAMLVSLPFWIIGGLLFGYVSRKKEKTDKEA